MSGLELLVVITGAAMIVWVNWYFLLAERGTVQAVAGQGGKQEVTIVVQGGYEPGEVRVKRGVPARLIFDRQDSSACAEEVVIPAFGVKRYLRLHEKTAIEIDPEEAGTFEITCGMSMMRGRLTVEE